MRRIVVLLLVALLSASVIASTLPRHLNPQQVEPELPSRFELLMLYGSIVDAVLGGNFTQASENIRELIRVYVPENIKYIYNRFNELLGDEVSKLNETNRLLNEAEEELSLGFLDDARKSLEKAGESLAEAELIHSELMDSCREFSRALRLSLSQLLDKLGELSDLIKLYHDRLSALLAQLKQLEEEKLLATELVIQVNSTEVLVGSRLQVSGVLCTEDGHPLEGKDVMVYIGGGRVGKFLTREDGSFQGVVRVPYTYRPEVKLFAEYVPGPEDFGKLKASRSNVIILKLIYEVPVIDARLNVTNVTPLEVFEVSGRVLTSGNIVPEEVYVSAFGKKVETDVLEDGFFRVVFKVPERSSEGLHDVIVYTEPHGVLAPARRVLKINVYRIPTHLVIEAPAIALSGTEVEIRGRLFIEGSSSKKFTGAGEVIVKSFGEFSSFQVEGTAFRINLTIPLAAPSGFVGVRVSFNPSSPIYRGSSAQAQFLIVNPLMILIPLSAVVYLARIGFRELSKKRRAAFRVEAGRAGVVEVVKPVAPPPEGITRVYLEAVRVVEDMTGVKRRASDTIREFLNKVIEKLGDKAPAFAELSYMTEAAVYGGVQPDMELAEYLLEGLRGRVYEE